LPASAERRIVPQYPQAQTFSPLAATPNKLALGSFQVSSLARSSTASAEAASEHSASTAPASVQLRRRNRMNRPGLIERSPRNPNTRRGRIILLKVRRVNPERAELESATLTAHDLTASASAAGGGSGRGATLFGGTSMRRNLWMSAVALTALTLGSQAS